MSTRNVYILALLIVGLILGTSVYLQVYDGFQPCPLCTLQRIAFAGCGVFFLLGCFLHRVRLLNVLIPLLSLIVAIAGGMVAGRQIYLQLFTQGSQDSCGVSLQYMLSVLPLNEAFSKIFAGSAECSQRGLEFLWMNMAEWSLLMFVVLGVMSVYLMMLSSRKVP